MSVEQNGGFKFEYLEAEHILCYTVYSLKRDVIDSYAKSLQAEIYEKIEDGGLFLALFDYRQAGVMLTPYFLGRIRAMKDIFLGKSYHGRAAIIAPLGVFRHLFNSINVLFTAMMPEIEIRFFANREEGLQWIKEYTENVPADVS